MVWGGGVTSSVERALACGFKYPEHDFRTIGFRNDLPISPIGYTPDGSATNNQVTPPTYKKLTYSWTWAWLRLTEIRTVSTCFAAQRVLWYRNRNLLPRSESSYRPLSVAVSVQVPSVPTRSCIRYSWSCVSDIASSMSYQVCNILYSVYSLLFIYFISTYNDIHM